MSLREAAKTYLGLGWSVIPIGTNKKPTVRWKEFQTRRPTPAEVDGWFGSMPIGKLARVVGAAAGGIWVLDADGPAAVEWAAANAPETPAVAISRKGRHFYYQSPPGVEVRNSVDVVPGLPEGSQVDVRGEGGYIIVPPSPHKDGFYEWAFGPGPGGPEIWGALPAWAPPSRRAEAASRLPGPGRGNGNLNLDLGGARDRLGVDDGPALLGERNDKLARLAGIWLARGNSRDETLLMALGWNSRNVQPLEAAEVEATVASVAAAHERNHGPICEVEFPDDDEPMAEPAGRAVDSLEDLPEDLFDPGGFVRMFMDFADRCAVVSYRPFLMLAGFCLLGTLAGQKLMTETGLRTNLYAMTLSPSGSGKDAPLKTVDLLITAAAGKKNKQNYLGATELASAAGLWKTLETRPNQLLVLDEIADLMFSVNKKPDSPKSQLIKDLKRLYTSTDRGFEKVYADTGRNFAIDWHCVSIYATGVSKSFFENLSLSDVTDGFIGRTLLLPLNFKAVKPRKTVDEVPPPELKEMAAWWINDFRRTFTDDEPRIPIPVRAPKTAEAVAAFDVWHDKYMDLQNATVDDDDGMSSVYARVPEQAHKLALLHAVNANPRLAPTVGLESVDYACRLMDWLVERAAPEIRAGIAVNPQDGLLRRVRELLKTRGKVSREEIYRTLRDCTHKQAEDVVAILVNSGRARKVARMTKGGESYALMKL